MSRLLVSRLAFGASFTLALILIVASLLSGLGATVAGALAVLAAVVSAWTSLEMTELQKRLLLPDCQPSIDLHSRYGLALLRVTNVGGSVARNIRLEWDKPPLTLNGLPVRFTQQPGAPDIAVLLPKETIAVLIDGVINLFKSENLNWSGKIIFEDASGHVKASAFYISAEQYRSGILDEQEKIKTYVELQKIPEEIRKLCQAVELRHKDGK